ncbi:MAG TPA: cytochrome C, partial [Candidatus Binatia bacterium]|nr:cytochrome C [Candidatus Binatia bacterium]
HGNDGRGQTTIGRNLYPRVPDMTANSTQAMSDGELFYAIKHGVRFTGMPAWGDDNPADDFATWTLVLFIRHLPDLTARELEVMATLNPKSLTTWRAEEEQRRFLEGDDLDPAGPAGTK